MADQEAHKIVGLIEHAELCQKNAKTAQEAMNLAVLNLLKESQTLDARIATTVEKTTKNSFQGTADTIRNNVADSLDEPIKALQRASVEVGRVVDQLSWRVVAMVAVMVFSMSLVPLATWKLFVPSAAELSELRSERDALVSDVNRLKTFRSVTVCGPNKLPCARVQINGIKYGSDGDYLLLRTTD